MEKYTMLMDQKNEYSENEYTTRSNLQIQCNPYQATSGIFHRTRTNNFKVCMEIQKNLEQPKHTDSNLSVVLSPDQLQEFYQVYFLSKEIRMLTIGSVQFSRSVVSNSLRPHQSQHARLPCPSLSPSSVQFSSVTQLCPTLCDPMNRSMPGLPVHHQLLEFTQTPFSL